ncbi:MAG: hypothetical protein HZB29_09360 [Nitrospinae bacterium]|nr:hypothetical protein [Nitrospinota bacterium]
MQYGRLNIIAGCTVIFIAAIGGFALAFSLDPLFEKGFYAPSYARTLLKAGHSHGMPFALYNMIVGGLVDRLALSDPLKRWLSYLAVGAFLMPLGLTLRGMTGGSMAFAPVVLLGALCFLASAGLTLKGALKA